MNAQLHYNFDVRRGQQRFRELIVYICAKCATDPGFGATKLNKILYHSDFRSFERFGVPLTGMVYQKLRFGPAPRALLPTVRELASEGAIREAPPQDGPFDQKRTIALRPAYLDHFTGDEIALVDEVIKDCWGKTATAVSDESHGVAWRARNMGDSIPYEAVFLSDERPTEDDITDIIALNEKYGWDLRL